MPQPVTVAQLITALRKQKPDAIVLWDGAGSCVTHAVESNIRAVKVSELGNGCYSMLGPERDIAAILLDTVTA